MHTTRLAAVVATAIGLALTAGCSNAPDTGTAQVPAATRPAQSVPPDATSLASEPVATGEGVKPTGGTTRTMAGAAPTGRADSVPVLTWTGLAGVPLGADTPAFAAALRHRLDPLDATNQQTLIEYRCAYRDLRGMRGLALRITGADADGPVQVISLSQGSRIQTSAGISLGDSLDEVRRAYGAYLLDRPFDFWPEDGHAPTAQATDGARLVLIRLGRTPDVYAPEGCV